MNLNISFDEKTVKPFEWLGLTGEFWSINIETLRDTFIAMAILFSLVLIARMFLKKDLNPVALVFQKAVLFFDDLCKESFGGKFKYEYFCFSSTIFFFTLFGCLVGLLPFVEETTKDLNTAFAMGSLSFFYVNYHKIKEHGVWKYLKEFAEPIFILIPLNIIGELAKVASMSFRLFGNILGGSIIFLIAVNALAAYKELFMILSLVTLTLYALANKFVDLKKHKVLKYSLISGLILVFSVAGAQMFFGIFEGFVQSFVLTMLTITYLVVGIGNEDDENDIIEDEEKIKKCESLL